MKFEIEESNEYLSSSSGLVIVGECLTNRTHITQRLNNIKIPGLLYPEHKNAAIVSTYIALLCTGKNDFDHVETYRGDKFFTSALNIKAVPSSPTMRQRLDCLASNPEVYKIILEESARLLRNVPIEFGTTITRKNGTIQSSLPIDIDVSPFDNSRTKKEGVSRTYKGMDGYSPIFAYMGNEGYWINVELRPGKTHCQKGTTEFLTATINYARQIKQDNPLLIRMDSGNDSQDNMIICIQNDVDFIIKHNPRQEKLTEWLEYAKQNATNSYVDRLSRSR
jgi:hypothetical protein